MKGSAATGTLFDQPGFPVPSQRSSVASQDGARAAKPRARSQAGRILRALASAGDYGLTAPDLCAETGTTRQAMCGRLCELQDPARYSPMMLGTDPLVEQKPDDERRENPRTRVRVTVWTITDAGRRAI